jgi:hypothetical protein
VPALLCGIVLQPGKVEKHYIKHYI